MKKILTGGLLTAVAMMLGIAVAPSVQAAAADYVPADTQMLISVPDVAKVYDSQLVNMAAQMMEVNIDEKLKEAGFTKDDLRGCGGVVWVKIIDPNAAALKVTFGGVVTFPKGNAAKFYQAQLKEMKDEEKADFKKTETKIDGSNAVVFSVDKDGQAINGFIALAGKDQIQFGMNLGQPTPAKWTLLTRASAANPLAAALMKHSDLSMAFDLPALMKLSGQQIPEGEEGAMMRGLQTLAVGISDRSGTLEVKANLKTVSPQIAAMIQMQVEQMRAGMLQNPATAELAKAIEVKTNGDKVTLKGAMTSEKIMALVGNTLGDGKDAEDKAEEVEVEEDKD